MDLPRRPPEFILEIFADAPLARDLVTGILHTIFFHRFFPSIRPKTQEVLDLTLPYVDDVELETLIDQRVRAFIDGIKMSTRSGTSPRGEVAIMFFEKRRRRTWFKSEEEVCWEQWVVKFTLANPRTELGKHLRF
jgi:autophagy-related protein 101